MSPRDVHQCPRCELLFATMSELESHLGKDHGVSFHHPPKQPRPEPVTTRGTVVVPVDPSQPAPVAVAVAAAIARQGSLAVEVVAMTPAGLSEDSTVSYMTHRAREAVAAGAPKASTWVLSDGDPADGIVDHVRATHADLVCLSSHAKGALTRVLMGTVSEPVLRHSPSPVVMVGPRTPAPPVDGYGTLVVAVDDSGASRHVVGAADRLAQQLGAKIALVQVSTALQTSEDDEDPDRDDEEHLRALAQEVASPVTCTVLPGPDVAPALLDLLSREQGALAVLGTHGRTGVRRAVAGSVALDVVRHARCPVVLVSEA